MHFRKGILSTALSLSLLMPSLAFANTNTNILQQENDFIKLSSKINRTQIEQRLQNHKPELTPETKAKLIELKTKLKNEEITKDQFHQELKKLMPKNHEFKHKNKEFHKELSDETKEKLRELKDKLENGEITKDEFKKEIKQIIPKNIKSEKQ